MVGANSIAALEAVTFAERAGISPEALLDVVTYSTGDSFMLRRNVREFVLTGDFSARLALRLLLKDLRLYQSEARSLGVATPSGEPTLETFERGFAAGLGDLDFAAILKLLRK